MSPRRVYRGGSWFDLPQRCRSADRGVWPPAVGRVDVLGFRPILRRMKR